MWSTAISKMSDILNLVSSLIFLALSTILSDTQIEVRLVRASGFSSILTTSIRLSFFLAGICIKFRFCFTNVNSYV